MGVINTYTALAAASMADDDIIVGWDTSVGAVRKMALSEIRSFYGFDSPADIAIDGPNNAAARVRIDSNDKNVAAINIGSTIDNASFPTSSTEHYAARPIGMYIKFLANSANIANNYDVVNYGITVQNYIGSATVAARGTHHSRTTRMWIQNCATPDGSGTCEHAFDMATLNIGSAGLAPQSRTWFTDWSLHGPIGQPPKLLNGITMLVNNYYNGSPTDGPSGGMWLVSAPGVGGQVPYVDTGHVNAATYAVNVGLGIVGRASGTGNGFAKGIQVGGYGSGWMTGGPSRIGTGIEILDYDDGIYIHGRKGSGYSLRVASDAGDVRFDGNITDGTNTVTVAQLAALVASHP